MYQETSELVSQRSFELELLLIIAVSVALVFGGLLLVEQLRKKLRRRSAGRRAMRHTHS
jgi:hypothetical protein